MEKKNTMPIVEVICSGDSYTIFFPISCLWQLTRNGSDEIINVSQYGSSKLSSDVPPTRAAKVSRVRVTKEIVSTKGDALISVQEYEKRRNELLSRKIKDEFDEKVWASLEDEFAYRKLLEKYTPILSDEYVVCDEYEIVIRDAVVSEYKHIKPLRSLGGDLRDTSATYNRKGAIAEAVRQEMEACGQKEVDGGIGQRPGTFRIYTSGKDVSVFADKASFKWETGKSGCVTDAYPICVKRLQSDIASVKEKIRSWHGSVGVPLDSADVAQDLQLILNALDSVEVKVRSADKINRVRRSLRDLHTKVIGAASEKPPSEDGGNTDSE